MCGPSARWRTICCRAVPPTTDKARIEMMLLGASSAPAPLASSVANVGSALARVIDRALRVEKRDRWPSARDMQSALAEAYRETFGTDLVRRGPRRPDPARPVPHDARPQRREPASTLRSRVDLPPSSSRTQAATWRSATIVTDPAAVPRGQRRQRVVGAAGMASVIQGTALVSTSTAAPALLWLGGLGIAFGVWLLAWATGLFFATEAGRREGPRRSRARVLLSVALEELLR